MNKEDLIKKLENVEIPEIKLPSHQQRLKSALLNSEYFKEKTMSPVLFWSKRLIPAGVVLVLILVVGFFTFLQPRNQIARAMEIIKNDPKVQEMIQKNNLEIKDIKVKDGKAYVLLTMKEGEDIPAGEKEEAERILKEKLKELLKESKMPEEIITKVESGESIIEMVYEDEETGVGKVRTSFVLNSLVEIDLKGKKIENIDTNLLVSNLTEEEKNKAIEIAEKDKRIKKVFSDERSDYSIEVRPLPLSKGTLEEENGKIVVKPAQDIDKRALVFLRSTDGKETADVIVNLTKEEIEMVGISGEKGIEGIEGIEEIENLENLKEGNQQTGKFQVKENESVCKENGKPIIRMYSLTHCPHCQWIKEAFKEVAKKYEGKIIAHLWQLDTGDDEMTEKVESEVPSKEKEIYEKTGGVGVPTFVFGCKYYRIGNAYENEENGLEKEKAQFREIIEKLLSE